MKNKIIAILLTISLIIVFRGDIFASESTLKSENLDLKSSIEMAIMNSNALKLYDEKIIYASQRYQLANAESAFSKAKDWNNDIQLISNKKEEILYPLQRKNEISQLNWEKQSKMNSITLDVTKAYFQILNKESQIIMKRDAIKRLNNELSIKKQQVSKGVDVKDSITNQQLSINQEIQKLEILERDKDIQLMKLNALLSQDVKSTIVLQNEQIPYLDNQTMEIDKLIKDQIINNHEIVKTNLDLEEAKIELDIIRRYSNISGTNGIDDIEDNILELEYKLKDKQIEIEVNIRSDYNTLLNLNDDIEINGIECEKCKKLSETANTKFKIGMMTAIDYEKIKANENDALTALNQAKVDYFIASENFKTY